MSIDVSNFINRKEESSKSKYIKNIKDKEYYKKKLRELKMQNVNKE